MKRLLVLVLYPSFVSQKASSEKGRAGSQTISSPMVCRRDGEFFASEISPGNSKSIPRGDQSQTLYVLGNLKLCEKTICYQKCRNCLCYYWIVYINPRSEPCVIFLCHSLIVCVESYGTNCINRLLYCDSESPRWFQCPINTRTKLNIHNA